MAQKQLTDKTQAELGAGEEKSLPAGDDLAAQALEEAQGTELSAGDDEVAASDQIAQTLHSLQALIERNANQLDELKHKLKEQREALRNIFENDTELSVAEEQVKSFSSQAKERKSKLLADPTVVRLKTVVAELREEQTETEETLSSHLLSYYQLTNSKSIDTSDGDQREFVIKARIKPARKK